MYKRQYFGNAGFLKQKLTRLEEAAQVRDGQPFRTIVLDATATNRIDSTAARTLEELVEDFDARGVAFYIAGVKGPVMDVLRKGGLVERMGEHHLPLRVEEAVQHAQGGRVPGHPLLAAR